MKRIFCFLIIIFTACTAACNIKVDPAATPLPELSPPSDTLPATSMQRQISVPLYFLNLDGTRLVRRSRSVTIGQDDMRLESAVRALINGPTEADCKAVLPSSLEVLSIEKCNDIVSVNFSKGFKDIPEEDQLIARQAITNTVCEISLASYVCIYCEGRQLEYTQGVPFPPLQRSDVSVAAMESMISVPQKPDKKKQKNQDPDEQISKIHSDIVVYYKDLNSGLLLPEVRRSQVVGGGYASAVIDEFLAGPRNIEHQIPFAQEGTTFQVTQDQNILMIQFENFRLFESGSAEVTEKDFIGGLIYSIMGTVSDISGISVFLNGNLVVTPEAPSGILNKEPYQDMLGDTVLLYFSSLGQENALFGVSRVVPQKNARSVSSRIHELMKGPQPHEDINAKPVFPQGVSREDLLSSFIDSDILYVNFSENFKEKCGSLGHSLEYVLTYSLVNTLTEMFGVNKVQFLIEGKMIDHLGGGLYYKVPLMRNPGIIKTR